MSSLLNKAKDKLEATLEKRENNKGDNPRSDNYGPHGSNVTNKLDPNVDSDLDNRNNPSSRVGGYGNTQSHDQYSHPQATGGFGASDNYSSNTNNPGYNNPQSGNSGLHSSNLLNKADPRVDSDRDGRNDPSSRVGGYGNTQSHDQYSHPQNTGGFGTSDNYSSNTNNPGYNNPQSGNAGPHSSNLMNKVDPRVDSDRDGRNDPSSRIGGHGNTQQYGDNYGQTDRQGGYDVVDTGRGPTNYGGLSEGGPGGYAPTHEATTGGYHDPTSTHVGHSGHQTHTHGGTTGGLAANTTTGLPGSTGHNTGYDNPQSTNQGPHSSNLMNKLDPRADSDRDHRADPTSRVGGYGNQGDNYGQTTGIQGGNYGHPSGVQGGPTGAYTSGNAGYDNSSYTPGSGNASKTAGPHNSNILNTLDPRVDSDMDGSKTYGGNQTHR